MELYIHDSPKGKIRIKITACYSLKLILASTVEDGVKWHKGKSMESKLTRGKLGGRIEIYKC